MQDDELISEGERLNRELRSQQKPRSYFDTGKHDARRQMNEKIQTSAFEDDVAKDLQQLGSGQTKYPTRPEDAVLETFDNKWPDSDYVVEIECPEYTSLCPITKQPDFATLKILYIPDKKLVESKSLKLYLFSFRNHGEFHESVVGRIAHDLYGMMKPKIIMVRGDFFPRGGISINPTVILPQETPPQYNKMIMDVWNHHEDGR